MDYNLHSKIANRYQAQKKKCQLWPWELAPCPKPVQTEYVSDGVKADYILSLVQSEYGTTIERLRIRKRSREIVKIRQIAMYLLKKYTKCTLNEIGEYFNGYDHTTVIHSSNTVEELKASYLDYREQLNTLESKIKYQK